MLRSLFVALVLLGVGTGGTATAQTWPTRPITMIVPFTAGGPTDVIARIVGQHMSRTLGQQIIIENVIGAGGTVGSTRGAQAAPDGYVLTMGQMGTHGAAPAMYPRLKYDPVTDFAPVGMAAGTPILIVARKQFPPNTLKEFLTYVKANTAKVNEAHAGAGSVSFTSCTLLNSQLGLKFTQVAYRGTGPALNDLVSGQVDFMCDQIVNLVEQVKSGNIKAYAIATPQRSPALPNVPTTKEAGLPEYQVTAWNALFAPKGTPPAIVNKVGAALDRALDDANVRKRLLELGAVIPPKSERSPAWLGTFVKAEVARWTPILKAAGAKGE
jgi:tripartite-type tricarboxylate transporter receptor subunit TctC